jgi:hypothetical protein
MCSDTHFGFVFEGFLVGRSPVETQPPKNTTICTTKKDQRSCKEKRKTGRSRTAMATTMTGKVNGCGMNGTVGTKLAKWMRCGINGMPQEN